MNSPNSPVYRIGDVEVDTLVGSLRRDGQVNYLREQTLMVFRYLIEHGSQTVTKEELIENVWQGTAVTDDAIVQCIVEIRKAFGDDPRHPQFIKTVPKTGYRFIAPVEKSGFHERTTVETEEVTSVQVEEEKEITFAEVAAKFRFLPRVATSSRVAFTTALILLLTVALGLYLYRRHLGSRREVTNLSMPGVAGKKPIAVMFFENRSGEAELDWLREGLADMLITNLSRSTKFIVLNRQQLHVLLERIGHKRAERIQLDEALEIARRGKAEAIVLGSFAKLGEKVRIDIQLHDVADGRLLAAESLNADKVEQILTRVDLLSLKLAAHFGEAPTEQESGLKLSGAMTNNLEAYRYYSLALEKAQAYHTNEAIGLWQKALALDPQFAMAYARIGYTHAFIRVNELQKSKPYLEKAFQLSHRLTERDKLYIVAWYAFANEGRTNAITAFRRLIAQYPQEAEAYFRLGQILTYQGSWEEAIDIFRQGLVIDQEAPYLHNALGFAYSNLGRFGEAISAHQTYVQLRPLEPNAHDSLGMTYSEAGQYDEALAEFERALTLDPKFHFANLHIADSYFHLGRYRAAIKQYRQFLQFAPSDWDRAVGYNRLALVYWKHGDVARAQAAANQELKYYKYLGGPFLIALVRGDFETAQRLKAQIFDNSSETFLKEAFTEKRLRFWRGLYALKTGHADEAIEQFKEVVKRVPLVWNIDGVEDCLGNAYLELGRLDEAIAEYDRLLRLNPNYAPGHYNLAQAYERKGQGAKARALYERFLELWKDADPDLPEVLDARKRLSAS